MGGFRHSHVEHEWIYGPGWSAPLLAAYGVSDDPVRTRYYRLLWDLGP